LRSAQADKSRSACRIPFGVNRHRDEFLEFIRSTVDILIANESEITALYQASSFEAALEAARADIKLAALTRSEKGSVILSAGMAPIVIPAAPVAAVVDTTGAGDLYAAGLIYGISRGWTSARRAGSEAWPQATSSDTWARARPPALPRSPIAPGSCPDGTNN
jgi:sugar/nucleoside kinase (ribokinase family)